MTFASQNLNLPSQKADHTETRKTQGAARIILQIIQKQVKDKNVILLFFRSNQSVGWKNFKTNWEAEKTNSEDRNLQANCGSETLMVWIKTIQTKQSVK